MWRPRSNGPRAAFGGIGGGGGDGSHYIAPTVVATGVPRLQKMEEVKLATAYYLCWSFERSMVEVLEGAKAATTRRCCGTG